jgi:phospholipase/lecithinase/hemolysin
MYHRIAWLVCLSLICDAAGVAFTKASAFHRLYVFGDSYSDIGAGYLDGNGPTAVAYLAEKLGFQLFPSNQSHSAKDSLDFAVSGATTGTDDGRRMGTALLNLGMQNQVADFESRVREHKIRFDPKTTLFFIAGGLNNRDISTEVTVANLAGEIHTLYQVGGRYFELALLPAAIPAFSQVALRLNPAISKIPKQIKAELPDAEISLSHWGEFFDEVMKHPAQYGILDTQRPCAGRQLFNQDPTPCVSPNSYFYYHANHPSTAVQKVVGEKLAQEVAGLTAGSK